MQGAKPWLVGAVLVMAVLVGLLHWNSRSPTSSSPQNTLLVYCAAGVQGPVEAAIHAYQLEYGRKVDLQYGGSGTLLSNLRVARQGDLFIAADESYLWTGRSHALVKEILPLATMEPVIVVRQGNPLGIRGVDDLFRCRVALANPDAAAIGRVVERLLTAEGRWETLRDQAKVFKPTVMDVANDVKLGTVDAGIVWDATARGYSELSMVRVPGWAEAGQRMSVGVLASSSHPASALHLARYLTAPERGLQEFERRGYAVVRGDSWEDRPEVVLFSGGINRLAIEDTLRQFEEREGVRITRVYNGCGILVAQMKAGQRPDAYFACDTSFMREVTNLFPVSSPIAESDIVLVVPQGNPRQIKSLADLAKPGLRLGMANPGQSALGALTERLLRAHNLWERVLANVQVQTPTADLLVNQMRTGALDVVVVYAVNVSQARDRFEIIPVREEGSVAVQPYAVRVGSSHAWLMARLQDALCDSVSRSRFEQLGFRWRAGAREGGRP